MVVERRKTGFCNEGESRKGKSSQNMQYTRSLDSMTDFRVNGRPIRHIFHRFQNVPSSCERSLNLSDNIEEV